MRIKNVLFVLLLLCAACNKSEKETSKGLKYKVVKAGDGIVGKKDDVLVFNFKLIDARDSVWTDTYANGVPGAVMIQDTSMIKYEDDMMEVLRNASAGDSIIVDFTMHDFFAKLVKRARPKHLDSAMMISYRLKVDSISTREIVMKFQQEISDRKTKEQFGKDLTTLDQYLASNNIETQKTESGLRYVITKPGQGENAQTGQKVMVNYAGHVLSGEYFDSNIKELAMAKGLYDARREPYEPYDVTIDQSNVIAGWHETLKLMNKGCKVTVYIPSGLAYGMQSKGNVIKPNSILVFDMEVVDVK